MHLTRQMQLESRSSLGPRAKEVAQRRPKGGSGSYSQSGGGDRKHKRNYRDLREWNHLDLSFRDTRLSPKSSSCLEKTTRYMRRKTDPSFRALQVAAATVTPLR